MNHKCEVVLASELEEIKKSKLHFKKEWAEILMQGSELSTRDYKVDGTLKDIQCGKGVVLLEKGILLHLPLEYIKIDLP